MQQSLTAVKKSERSQEINSALVKGSNNAASLPFSTASKTFWKQKLHSVACANAEVSLWFTLNNWLLFATFMTK